MTNEKRVGVFIFQFCPHSWAIGLSMFWVADEKLFELSIFPFHLAVALDKKKQAKFRKLGRRY